MVNSAIAVNLKRLRIARGLSQDQAAQAAQLSRQAYISIEKGKAEPRVKNLEKIAKALDSNVFNIVALVPELKSIRFRSQKKLSKKEEAEREQVVTGISLWLRDFNELEDVLADKVQYAFKNLDTTVSGDRREAIIKIAGFAREKLGLRKDEPINDICGLMESAGIKIHFVKAELKGFFGLSVLECDGGPVICINVRDDITVERQIFTVAHELGHLLLHRASFDVRDAQEKAEEESEADIFASYFLMPQEVFKKAWEENKGLHWVNNVLHMKRIFKVSYRTIIRRLEDEGMKRDLMKEFAISYQKMYKHDLKNHYEPMQLDPIDFLEDRLKRLVRVALEKEEITVSRAAEILNIRVSEMRELMNAWAMVQ
jgi:Zn-dependent peptidase ImmA (M78 family)/DNA-binding XRE family transcriptional regulator